MIDFSEQFVKSTYNLEVDGALIVTCYEEILKLRAVVHSSYYQNLEAVIQSFSQGNAISSNGKVMPSVLLSLALITSMINLVVIQHIH